ncbi:MAG: glycosyltransferase [Spirochaetes bacterium]|nr:glycosyltransferase [Spirochaetota bacterium]
MFNILYIGGFELPDKNAAAQRVIANGKLLRSLGHNVKYLGVSKDTCFSSFDESYNKYYDFDTWSVNYPKSTKEWIKYVTEINKIKLLIDSNKLDPDIIITYNFPALSSAKLIKYCKKNKIRIIGDITEWYGHRVKTVLGLVKYIDSEMRMRLYNKKLDGLICISKFLYDYYKNSVKNLIQIPPLVDLSDKKWKVEILPKKDKKVIVYAGSPGGKDKINFLIDALLEVENISQKLEFRIIGITKEDFLLKNSYYTENQTGLISEFSVFLGRLPHLEVIKEVSNADFSAFFREKNKTNDAGFPTKFVESISCGTPVLTNKTSNLEDYLVEGGNGFLLEKIKFNELIEISRSQIDIMKQYCAKTNIFDFKNFQNLMKKII